MDPTDRSMPPEMMTIVAPTAMTAKKLASVAVWISVYELKKLLTSAPVSRSTWDPANAVRRMPRVAMTRTSPACSEARSFRKLEHYAQKGGQTGVRPGSDRGQTGVRPGSDRGQTGVRPGSDHRSDHRSDQLIFGR